MSRAPSRKQRERVRLTAEQVRERNVRKQLEADRASWLLVGGEVEWQREQNRRRKARNERTRARTAAVLAAKRAAAEAEAQQPLWKEAA